MARVEMMMDPIDPIPLGRWIRVVVVGIVMSGRLGPVGGDGVLVVGKVRFFTSRE